MQRPVWLFSMDTEQFSAPPLTTGGLKSYFVKYGETVAETDVELVHFLKNEEISTWLQETWLGKPGSTSANGACAEEASGVATAENSSQAEPGEGLVHRARRAIEQGLEPVVGFSCYTWNVAEFLELIAELRASCPGLLVVVGGPHVQESEEFLVSDGIDVVVLGEAETTFTELLDCPSREGWPSIAGLAYVGADGKPTRNETRGRSKSLDDFPSALDVIELRDAEGKPRFERAAVETSRGCPFKCSFCEWGTGAIGTKMYQFSLERFRDDVERLVEGGIQDIWLCDSNFGALREDVEKAKILVEVKKRTGSPSTFATSWHKHHNDRVQEIVMLMHENGLLQHYNLALQTLTPLALELSHRKNMKSNAYEPIAKAMAEEGVSIASELIWGLPGDTLAEFEDSLDQLVRVFPNINIFGYTLLPGTEFYRKRDEYKIDAIPVAGYGRAKGEYVVGCHTFDRDEGIEGYFLISAHILLIRGYVIPLATRFLALRGGVPVSGLLRAVLRALTEEFAADLPEFDLTDRMDVYENRDALYLVMLREEARTFGVIRKVVDLWVRERVGDAELADAVAKVLEIDRALCPRVGAGGVEVRDFAFDVRAVEYHLGRMESPPVESFASSEGQLCIRHPSHVGEVLRDPDGGSWMRGVILHDEPDTDTIEVPRAAASWDKAVAGAQP